MNLPPFVRFLLTGGLAAAINLGSRLWLSTVMSFEIAVVIAYIIGMITAYVLARMFVFAPSGSGVWAEVTKFALVNLLALVQVWLVSVLLVRWLFPAVGFTWNAELVGHALGVLSPVVTSYYGHKLFTFRAT